MGIELRPRRPRGKQEVEVEKEKEKKRPKTGTASGTSVLPPGPPFNKSWLFRNESEKPPLLSIALCDLQIPLIYIILAWGSQKEGGLSAHVAAEEAESLPVSRRARSLYLLSAEPEGTLQELPFSPFHPQSSAPNRKRRSRGTRMRQCQEGCRGTERRNIRPLAAGQQVHPVP